MLTCLFLAWCSALGWKPDRWCLLCQSKLVQFGFDCRVETGRDFCRSSCPASFLKAGQSVPRVPWLGSEVETAGTGHTACHFDTTSLHSRSVWTFTQRSPSKFLVGVNKVAQKDLAVLRQLVFVCCSQIFPSSSCSSVLLMCMFIAGDQCEGQRQSGSTTGCGNENWSSDCSLRRRRFVISLLSCFTEVHPIVKPTYIQVLLLSSVHISYWDSYKLPHSSLRHIPNADAVVEVSDCLSVPLLNLGRWECKWTGASFQNAEGHIYLHCGTPASISELYDTVISNMQDKEAGV